MSVVQLVRRQAQELNWKCSACGADRGCDCTAPAVEKVAEALARSPEKSSRAIAKEAGVSHTTVDKIRAATGNQLPVDKRVGLDGRARGLPAPKIPTKAEANASEQNDLYEHACYIWERMTGSTRKKFLKFIEED